MLDAIESACSKSGKEFDAVFLVGDIAYNGKESEYIRFEDDFLTPLRKLSFFESAKIFVVPGNHDVDCDATVAFPWKSVARRHQDVFFQEDEDGKRARSSRVEVFRNYSNFISKNGLIGPDPFKEVGIYYTNAALPVDILATNTSFFSDKEEDSSLAITPAPLASLHHLIPRGLREKPLIILGHHPITCFVQTHQRPFKTLLLDKKAVFIHGHEHEPKATFDHQGFVQSIGFGASYIATTDDQKEAPWQNSFTLCYLNGTLEIEAHTWQPHPGAWINTTQILFSECLDIHGIARVRIPLISAVTPSTNFAIKSSTRSQPHISKILPLSVITRAAWSHAFGLSQNLVKLTKREGFSLRDIPVSDGKIQMVVETKGRLDLLIAISGVNHALSSTEIESLNTELDTTDYESITVISLGRITDEAKTMYTRLRAKKPLEVLTNTDLSANGEKMLTAQQQAILAKLDAATTVAYILLGKEASLVVIENRPDDSSFYIVDLNGNTSDHADEHVSKLRKDFPEFAKMHYAGAASLTNGQVPKVDFDTKSYLANCYKEYNVLKYAALASAGIRFSDLPLEELYVEATASEVHTGGTNRLEEIVSDHVASLPATDALKDHLQKHLLRSVELNNQPEVSVARDYCKKYPAVLITGDPGSGKSCFLKSEILAYCRSSSETAKGTNQIERVWYENHIPLMLQLSELVAEKDLNAETLYVVIERLLQRRGLSLPASKIESFATEGRIAWFFDGLDEVVSIEKRASVVKHINTIVEQFVPLGCRVVVTSRAAAVHVVNLLPSLHKLELQGLGDAEIRRLAAGILSIKLRDDEHGVVMDQTPTKKGQNHLINQLIDDCNSNPGISRLARNPLLLTLLIMIYANSGAPSAKRHLIYESAIQTLASVRRREAGHQSISVQDLKMRLGAVAISVYRRHSGLLPSRNEVVETLRKVMTTQRGQDVGSQAADEFIQRVAESTGLIAVETRKDGGVVTFMHHSFLEYFAAVGLSQTLESEDFGVLVNEPRWHEILTLLSGIIGDDHDVAPIIEKILTAPSVDGETNARLLIFAIDCALECDVPSEAAQLLIASSIRTCLETQAGRVDPWIREEIGTRLAKLFESSGGGIIEESIQDLILSNDIAVSAAGISLAGHACSAGFDSPTIISAIMKSSESSNDFKISAICDAASEASTLRTESILEIIGTSLKGSSRVRRAAMNTMRDIPGLAAKYWPEIINGIDAPDKKLSNLASLAALRAGLSADVLALDSSRKDVLSRAFRQLNEKAISPGSGLQISSYTARRLLDSPRGQDRELGIQMIPLSDMGEKEIHDELFQIIEKNENREEVVAAMGALYFSGSALDLITQGDLITIENLLRAPTIDVRIGATRMLGRFGGDIVAVDGLLKINLDTISDREFSVTIRALSLVMMKKDVVADLISKGLRKHLLLDPKLGESGIIRLKSLLSGAKNLGETLTPDICVAIRSAIDDYKLDMKIRKNALLCYPSVTMPSINVVEELVKIYKKRNLAMESELVQVLGIFAKNCRKKIDFVFACIDKLPELRNQALDFHRTLRSREVNEKLESLVSNLREGIDDVTQIIMAFEEIERQDA